jgi:hypothetical protein
MPMVCQEIVIEQEKERWKRERRNGKEFLVCTVRIRMEFRTNFKILSISSVETGVLGEKHFRQGRGEGGFQT